MIVIWIFCCVAQRLQTKMDNETKNKFDENFDIENGTTSYEKNRVSDLLFAKAMKKCGSVLLMKKKNAQIKALKKKAVKEIVGLIFSKRNVCLSESQVYKKINNMKSRIKSKKEATSTVVFNEGEKIFLNLLDTVENNPMSCVRSGNSILLEIQPNAKATSAISTIIRPGVQSNVSKKSKQTHTLTSPSFQSDVNTSSNLVSSFFNLNAENKNSAQNDYQWVQMDAGEIRNNFLVTQPLDFLQTDMELTANAISTPDVQSSVNKETKPKSTISPPSFQSDVNASSNVSSCLSSKASNKSSSAEQSLDNENHEQNDYQWVQLDASGMRYNFLVTQPLDILQTDMELTANAISTPDVQSSVNKEIKPKSTISPPSFQSDVNASSNVSSCLSSKASNKSSSAEQLLDHENHEQNEKHEWAQLDFEELKKLVLTKKLRVLELQGRFYETAQVVFEKFGKILDKM